ncbi:MAG: type II and III secretion system protein family protein [Rickettsiales bacterium]|nr:type II and III secretion system protein family protein [Pseudomonadota bacterium]MDA0966042.1 type II and III secretion system protein family protein [Pseudomonadota bacterium]MDG4542487.1 type II and III secretion system protein family protein [Rickettsiales bacterium]MDG4544991.1 type II and III secretion system protein family protein [Rickettsiales bacterium]MDG4547114.1 type II and III secretion system protein family protein [Rickettsiales bacterium]
MFSIRSLLLKVGFYFFMLLSFTNIAVAGDVINLTIGKNGAEIIDLPSAMSHVLIADREVAGVVKHAPKKVSVIGHGLGHTNIRFMNGNRIVRQVNVTVTQDLLSIKRTLSNLFPEQKVGVATVNGSVALKGTVSDAQTAAQIVNVVREYVGDENNVLNLMGLRSGQQVMLRVRVGEIRRDVLKKLGLGLHGVITSGSAVLGALEREGVFKVLAEPTLIAISGETADFLAGGEIPVPVIQAGNVMSVDYKPVGVSVQFTPVVLSENRIRLSVASEVSEVDAKVVSVNSISVPSISTRRANTTVEMASGESFMIAGLIEDSSKSHIHKVPGVGDLPILSTLFRSVDFQRNETELVIAVTPYLTDPVSGNDIRLPTDNFIHRSNMETFFLGSIGVPKNTGRNVGLEGGVGYLID